MANTSRRIRDKNNNQFLPMNVEGSGYNDKFMTTPKMVTIILILASLFLVITYLTSNYIRWTGWVILLAAWFVASLYALRYIVFEEKFYYRMYKEMQNKTVTTPATFWNIASVKDTEDGAILTYADAKVGIIVKVNRDTITGKPEGFEEVHYDAVSDFYRSVWNGKYNIVHMNLMEPAGNDPRLSELDKIAVNCENQNIKSLVQMQVGHIKIKASKSLYESDYYLIYTYNIDKVDYIVADVVESMLKLLDGAYIGYSILDKKELIELDKYQFGVRYFNMTDASLNIYKNESGAREVPFTIDGIVWTDGYEQKLENTEKNKLRRITSDMINETAKQSDISLKKTIYVKKEKNNVGIDFEKLGSIPSSTPVRPRPMRKTNGLNINSQQNRKVIHNQNNEKHQKLESNNISFDDNEDDDLIDI